MPKLHLSPAAYETVVFVATAGAVGLAEILVKTDFAVVTDWRVWALSLASAITQSAARAFLTKVASDRIRGR